MDFGIVDESFSANINKFNLQDMPQRVCVELCVGKPPCPWLQERGGKRRQAGSSSETGRAAGLCVASPLPAPAMFPAPQSTPRTDLSAAGRPVSAGT